MAEEAHWEDQVSRSAYDFALDCAKLYTRCPSDEQHLVRIVSDLITELWDRGFSQTDIRSAFEQAVAAMPRYAAGAERNGTGEGYGLYGDSWQSAGE